MRDTSVYNFLMKCDPKFAEQHSDSSDFESPERIHGASTKRIKNQLLSTNFGCKIKGKQRSERIILFNMEKYNRNTNSIPFRNSIHKFTDNARYEPILNYRADYASNFMTNKSTGDEFCLPEKDNIRTNAQTKVTPCVSTIFRRPRNRVDNADIVNYNDRIDCTYSKHKRMKRCYKAYSVQPVYTVEEDVQTSPFHVNNEKPFERKVDNYSEVSNFDFTLSLDADTQNFKSYKYREFLNTLQKRLEVEIRKEWDKERSTTNDQHQFYASNLHSNLPYQVFASSSCLAKCTSTAAEDIPKLPSSSSAFWSFFAHKLKNKFQTKNICQCEDPKPCTPEDCEKLLSSNTSDNLKQTEQSSECPSKTNTTTEKRETKEHLCVCKCNTKKKKKSNLKSKPTSTDKDSTDELSPCQKNHDSMTRMITEKYKGEILCIHNPPCVLINGCLNLPSPKSIPGSDAWPVTQNKKPSFVQKCRNKKKSKQKTDNANQYHPPYCDLEQIFPEFRSEKIIQSVCNHEPPCEIVHGCYRAKYDPNLQNSCVHVPMCPKIPECIFVKKNEASISCSHDPKCAEVPICSRKNIVLIAKEEIGIQAKPKIIPKMVCRHEPHCFMIPKCLAQAINGDSIPCGAIPGCVHNPPCENIPACCRKSVKQMVSVPCQYPNACRIV